MIASTVIQFADLEKAKVRIYEHVGRVVVTCADLDQRVVAVLQTLGVPADEIPADFAKRVKMLTKTLGAWPDAALLSSALMRVSEYRNNLGHSAVVSMIGLDGTTQHGGIRERNGMRFEPILEANMPVWERRASVLDFVILGLRHEVQSSKFATRRARDIAGELKPDPEVAAAVGFLFGPA